MTSWKVMVGTAALASTASLTFADIMGGVSKVDGLSMQPTLNPEPRKTSDYVLVNKWAASDYNFSRGEIVCLISPRDPDEKVIKRIIGLPSDSISTRSYKNHHVIVPKGHLWIEGDNHRSSKDSNIYGPVPMGLVYAKATRIMWPPKRWQKLKQFYPKDRVNHKTTEKEDYQYSNRPHELSGEQT